ncbi:sacsin N-terminal ATP-binding-like domain-containing protein [Labedaea rhizosphaerae]|uniref:Molecular chaperone Hsp90 n=1 Tax=Labedaea rhizosphaerae TaxID=598644 RepID=A0A4R6SL01_LABRH|nr:hypothetical protein [Labedaea rhizosphaerae]TDQ04531.1 hypothetical protein EV186_101483 [Labedaea rhizosphaerae]
MTSDPFGTAALRESVLASWVSSPTRLREDANAEEDLRLGGYADRLLVELAQNAADAALLAGIPGALRVTLVSGELRVANTGAPLTAEGVAALASLRASAKRDGSTAGRFGVGFAAVLAVTDEPRIVSRTGGVAFSAARSRAAFPDGEREPAVLRLPWPLGDDEDPVPDGFDTEVRLPLHPSIDGPALLARLKSDVDALLLALPWLGSIAVEDDRVERVTRGESEVEIRGRRWLLNRASGRLPDDVVATLGVEARTNADWSVCWAIPDASPVTDGVLYAPTPTEERLSIPAMLIASVPVEPSRRQVMRGPAADAVLSAAAAAYPALIAKVDGLDRTSFVPPPGFPRSDVDDLLRERVLAALREAAWLPAAVGPDLRPAEATVVDTPSPALAELIADVLPGVAHGSLGAPSHAQALAALGVRRLDMTDLVAALTGVDRAPSWWRELYAALAPVADVDAAAREAMGALPVPMADGRTLPGPRGALIAESAEVAEVEGVRLVHPDAVHPLLEKLGARRAGPRELLEALRDPVDQSAVDVESGVDVRPLVDTVLRLVTDAGLTAGELPWLGALTLPARTGDWSRADELVLPGAPMLAVLAPDSPLAELSPDFAANWTPDALAAVGVLDTFAVLEVDHPTGPDHELADEQEWWDTHDEPPSRLLAIRDLDLVADDAWPAALRLLASDPRTLRALREPGYTTWWLARYALIDGAPPRDWRLPDAVDLAGLYDPVAGLDAGLARAVGVRAELSLVDADDVEDLLARLADPDRHPAPGAILRAMSALAEAPVAPEDVTPPDRMRTLAGTVADADACAVLDGPWLVAVAEPDELVAVEDFTAAAALAELVDLPLASDQLPAKVDSDGDYVPWAELGAVVEAAELAGLDLPPGGPIVHDPLVVVVDDERHEVPWWLTGDGILHVADTPEALAAGFAWRTGDWPARHLLTALITDPDPRTYLA